MDPYVRISFSQVSGIDTHETDPWDERYIYLYMNCWFFMELVGKYTIHWSYGIKCYALIYIHVESLDCATSSFQMEDIHVVFSYMKHEENPEMPRQKTMA